MKLKKYIICAGLVAAAATCVACAKSKTNSDSEETTQVEATSNENEDESNVKMTENSVKETEKKEETQSVTETTEQESETTEQEEAGPNIVEEIRENYLGKWKDENQKLSMSISTGGDNYRINIIGKQENGMDAEWMLTGAFNSEVGGISYGGMKSSVVINEDGEEEERLEYKDGSGTMILDDQGRLIWNNTKENMTITFIKE